RRHTSCYRDWSSDVCSSDLFGSSSAFRRCSVEKRNDRGRRRPSASSAGSDTTVPTPGWFSSATCKSHICLYASFELSGLPSLEEIGRASCRGSGESRVGGGL